MRIIGPSIVSRSFLYILIYIPFCPVSFLFCFESLVLPLLESCPELRFHVVLFITLFSVSIKPKSVIIQMECVEQHYQVVVVVLFITVALQDGFCLLLCGSA